MTTRRRQDTTTRHDDTIRRQGTTTTSGNPNTPNVQYFQALMSKALAFFLTVLNAYNADPKEENTKISFTIGETERIKLETVKLTALHDQ